MFLTLLSVPRSIHPSIHRTFVIFFAALLTFDAVTLTPKQGKGIAVPYRFGCLPESTLVAYRETVSFVYKVID